MAYFECIKTAEEIRTLDSYLEFGNKNLVNFKQRLATELEENIEKVRRLEFFQPEFSNAEIVQRIVFMDFDDEFFSTEEGKLFLHIWHNFYGAEFSKKYDEMFYTTIIIMLYSCIERGFKKLYDTEGIKDDYHQKVLDKTFDFLVGTLDYKLKDSDWQEIINIRDLRNAITHFGLGLPFDDSFDEEILLISDERDNFIKPSALIKYLKSKNIYSKKYGAISLNLEYCKYAIEFSRLFFLGISGHLSTNKIA